jgi:hypothetical protein
MHLGIYLICEIKIQTYEPTISRPILHCFEVNDQIYTAGNFLKYIYKKKKEP